MNLADDSTDVLVVGGGPAGLAAAIAARSKGFRVLVVDPAEPPIDKACGEGLMPDAVEALQQLGIAIPSGESFPFRGIRFIGDGQRVESDFPRGCGLGVRRTTLHLLLLERAVLWNVSFHWRTRVTELDPSGAYVQGRLIRARWVIGADGHNSAIGRCAGLDRPRFRLDPQRFGFRRHFRVAQMPSPSATAWMRSTDRSVSVWRLSITMGSAIPRSPAMSARLSAASRSGCGAAWKN